MRKLIFLLLSIAWSVFAYADTPPNMTTFDPNSHGWGERYAGANSTGVFFDNTDNNNSATFMGIKQEGDELVFIFRLRSTADGVTTYKVNGVEKTISIPEGKYYMTTTPIPLDGGLSFLLASGLGLGLFRRFKNKK